MEIEQLRQEINDLLENVVQHSNSYTAKEHLSSLDVSFVQKKVNKVQEGLTVLKYLLEAKHDERGESKIAEPSIEVVTEEVIIEEPVIVEETLPEAVEVELPVSDIEEPIIPEIQEEAEEEIEEPESSSSPKLAEALTLNDRYLFANELCNKDMNAFNELVKSIDNCSSFDEAGALYSSMDWEIDNEHVVAFINLVERRFS